MPHDASCNCDWCESIKHTDTKGAVIIVFDSKPDAKRKPAKKQRPTWTSTTPLTFINATNSGKQGLDDRKVIRTHVMSDYWRKHMAKKAQSRQLGVGGQGSNHMANGVGYSECHPSFQWQPLGKPDPFCSLPIKMQPFMYRLLDQCEFHTPGLMSPKSR